MKIDLDIKTFLSEELKTMKSDIDFCYDPKTGVLQRERVHAQLQKLSTELVLLEKIVEKIKEEIKTEDNFKITL